VAVDHDPGKFQLAHAALELVSRGSRILHREVAEAGIAVGALLDLPGKKIVRLARLAARGRDIAFGLHAGASEREHCACDPGLIHHLQALLGEILQPRHQRAIDGRVDVADRGEPVVLETGAQEVLFERDLANHTPPVSRPYPERWDMPRLHRGACPFRRTGIHPRSSRGQAFAGTCARPFPFGRSYRNLGGLY
jgi:hypothetical protein